MGNLDEIKVALDKFNSLFRKIDQALIFHNKGDEKLINNLIFIYINEYLINALRMINSAKIRIDIPKFSLKLRFIILNLILLSYQILKLFIGIYFAVKNFIF